jgi:uncharacterized membrane protein YfcA
MGLILLFLLGAWILAMTFLEKWPLFFDYWPMALTMSLGSFIAGASSEGGGAVAFPVLTLIFKTTPAVARDFSWMIQTVGMGTAAISLFLFRAPFYKRIILPVSLGGLVGLYPGLKYLAPLMEPSFCKIFFTSLWMSFGVWIFIIEKRKRTQRDRPKQQVLPKPFHPKDHLLLFFIGLIGGQISALSGTGLDLFTFAFLILYYNLDEKRATLTSIVLMAINSLGGVLLKGPFLSDLSSQAWSYWWVSVPIVIFGAPLGAFFIRGKSRSFILSILGIGIITQFLAAFIIIPMTFKLLAFSLFIFCGGFLFFYFLQKSPSQKLSVS